MQKSEDRRSKPVAYAPGSDSIIRSSPFAIRSSRRAITMIELLVVIVVIGILISSILVAGSALVTRSKINNTKATIQVVLDACEEFKHEQTAKPNISAVQQDIATASVGRSKVKYADRYGQYPPDELEVFTLGGLPGSKNGGSLASRGAVMVPAGSPKYSAMTFYATGDSAHDSLEHRDLAAMIVAIEAFGDSSASILSKIPDKNRTAGVVDASGNPAQFLDQSTKTAQPDGKWGDGDLQIRYIIDDWGNPLSYFSERDHRDTATNNIPSSNHANWNEISTELIRLNGGQPLIMSYGPDGKDQLTQTAMGNNAAASLIGDLSINSQNRHVTNPYNNDNVYLNASLTDKLAKGYGG